MTDKFQTPTGLRKLTIMGVKGQATLDELRQSWVKENGKFYIGTFPIVTVDVFKDAVPRWASYLTFSSQHSKLRSPSGAA